jgi:tRNA-Thr(GGU) m(6)t(6)A37 methyltransferase TsaA
MFASNTPAETMRAELSQIEVYPDFTPGLLRLKPGVDLLILFRFHRIEADEVELQLHPRHDPTNPLAGVFATRTQFRPSRIGTTVARLEKIEGNLLTLSGLDAQDGSPVIDIKPYAPYFDADREAQRFEVGQMKNLQAAREAIDLIDAEVIRLLGNRAKYVHQVAGFKNAPEDAPAPERYAAVMQRRRELAEAAGLNPDVIEGMYKLLVDNFIKEEMTLIRGRNEGCESA